MVALQFLLAISSLFIVGHCAAIAPSSKECKIPTFDTVILEGQVTHPLYFCTWYLEDIRTRSPLLGLTPDRLTGACERISKCATAQDRNAAAAAIKKASQSTTPANSQCPANSANFLTKEYVYTSAFCTFFNAYPRTTSPVPNQNTRAVFHACDCILGKVSTSSSTRKTSSATSKSSFRVSTTSSRKPAASTSSLKSSSYKTSSSTQKSSPSKSSSALKSSSTNKVSSSTPSSSTFLRSSTSSTRSSSSKSSSTLVLTSTRPVVSASTPSASSSKSSTSTSTSRSTSSSTKLSTSSLPASSTSSSSRSASKLSSSSKSQIPSPRISSSSSSSVSNSAPTTSSTSIKDAYDVITSQGYQHFCSEYLEFSTPYTIITATQTDTETIIRTDIATETSMSTYTSVYTEIDVSTITEFTTVTTASPTAAVVLTKRLVAVPPKPLMGYSDSSLSSACSKAAIPPETITIISATTTTTLLTSVTNMTMTAVSWTTEISSTTQQLSTTVTSTSTSYLPLQTTQVVVNPSFEIGGVNNGDILSPWVYTGTARSYINSVNNAFHSYDGNWFTALSGTSTATLSQTLVDLVPGATYTLQYYVWVRITGSGSSNLLTVTIGDQAVDNYISPWPAPAGYVLRSATYVATAESATIKFAINGRSYVNTVLDAITLTHVG